MRNANKLILGGVAAVVLIAGIVLFALLRPPAEASRPIEAVPLATTAPTQAAAPAPPTAQPTAAAAATDAPTALAAPTATEAPTAAPAAETIFEIIPAESQARFIIDEVLNNAPFTVVGVTDQVAGQLAVDPADPTRSRVGVIQVNARTLATDNEFRNRAIKNRILSTDQYEFITFEPTAISGLPSTGAVGQPYSFQITGNLTIRDVTREVTFDVTATPVSATRLEGNAQTTVLYADFGLSIPSVPSVASVEDEVRIEIDFVAAAS